MSEDFGHYRLVGRLGEGGFGDVWRAYDTRLDRYVALKALQAGVLGDAEAVARFRREAQLAGRLRHPHIVRVNATGEIDGRPFLDMELIEGPNLRSVLNDEGPLAPPRTLALLGQVAAALDAAHALDGPAGKRLVHRDVKPPNVIVEPAAGGRPERAYLADFGVARAVLGSANTRAVGTPDYVAPELWRAESFDHRVDVYALTVMAFEMLTGQLPYARTNFVALMNAHLTEPPPAVATLRSGLPASLDAVLRRGMAKRPGDRFGRATELVAAITEAFERPGPAGPVEPDRRGDATVAVALPATAVPDRTVPDADVTAPVVRSAARAAAAVASGNDPTEPNVPRPAHRGARPAPDPAAVPVVVPVVVPPPSWQDETPVVPARGPFRSPAPYVGGLVLALLLVPAVLLDLLAVDVWLVPYAVGLYLVGVLVTGLVLAAARSR